MWLISDRVLDGLDDPRCCSAAASGFTDSSGKSWREMRRRWPGKPQAGGLPSISPGRSLETPRTLDETASRHDRISKMAAVTRRQMRRQPEIARTRRRQRNQRGSLENQCSIKEHIYDRQIRPKSGEMTPFWGLVTFICGCDVEARVR